MNPLHRKCFFASAGLHGLLLVLFVVGSGFLASQTVKERPIEVLTFLPDILVDKAVTGGGDPAGTPQTLPPAAPPVQTPPPKAEPPPPEPSKVVEKKPVDPPAPKLKALPPKPEPDPLPTADTGTKPVPKPKPKPEVNLKPVVRKSDPAEDKKRREREEAVAEAAAVAQRERIAQARKDLVKGIAAKIEAKSSAGVSIQPIGPGGGASYGSYDALVQSIYQWAWKPPSEFNDESTAVKVRVVVRRDGSIESAEITQRSGVATFDRSVTTVLGRVTTVGRPFPTGATDDRRTYVIKFDLKAKRATG